MVDGADAEFKSTGVFDAVRAEEYGLSWVAYPRLLLGFFLRIFALTAVCMLAAWLMGGQLGSKDWPAAVGLSLSLLWTAYDVCFLRSIKLYIDGAGVWMRSGVFPWQKGVYGVKWRDVSEATFTTGFASWLLRSHTVRVGHRFTNGAELNIQNIRRGDLLVTKINDVLTGLSQK